MVTENSLERLEELEDKLGISFQDKQYLTLALTHSSFARRDQNIHCDDNERLEFLGDAVLKLIVSELFYDTFPDMAEGTLTKYRGYFVSDKVLAQMARYFNMGDYLLFSFGEERSGGAHKNSNLADSMEAILGAYYLDSGLDEARTFFLNLLSRCFPDWKSISFFQDYKSILQEWMQKKMLAVPSYKIVDQEGPDHDKIFSVEVRSPLDSNEEKGCGKGKCIKEAEQDAAKSLLMKLGVIDF